jgi:hypothetical protein
MIIDNKGREVKLGDELDVPLEVFSNGIVVLDKENQMCIELRFDGKLIPIKDLQHIKVK